MVKKMSGQPRVPRTPLVVAAAAFACILAGAAVYWARTPTATAKRATVAASPIQWKLLEWGGSTAFGTLEAQKFDALVKRLTHGRLDISILGPGELPYQQADYLQAIQAGAVQVADLVGNAMPGVDNSATVASLPLLATTYKGENAEIRDTTPELNAGFGKYGAKLLYYWPFPPIELLGSGSRPTSLASLKFMKVRTQGPPTTYLLEKLHAVPVVLQSSEVADSWAHGVVRGVLTTPLGAVGEGWTSLTKWEYNINLGLIPDYVVVSKRALASLPSRLRADVATAAADIQKTSFATAARDNAADIATLRKGGTKFINPPASVDKELVKLIRPYWTKYARSVHAMATLKAAEKASS